MFSHTTYHYLEKNFLTISSNFFSCEYSMCLNFEKATQIRFRFYLKWIRKSTVYTASFVFLPTHKSIQYCSQNGFFFISPL